MDFVSQCLKIKPMHFVNTVQIHISSWGSIRPKWTEMSPVKCRSQTRQLLLAYAPTKHSTRLQPILVTKHREKGFCHRLPRCRAPHFPCANHKVPKAGMCCPHTCPLGLRAARGSCRGRVQGEGTHVTGAGCSHQHLQGAFYTNLFLYRVVKKKYNRSPYWLFIQKSGIL